MEEIGENHYLAMGTCKDCGTKVSTFTDPNGNISKTEHKLKNKIKEKRKQ